jgi:hypothetical protein
LATFDKVRVRSPPPTACLPRVDIALRRASAAILAVLPLETGAAAARRARGADGRGADAGDDTAGALAGALRAACCCDFGNAAFPPADIARRRASATSLLLLVFALCAIVIPATCTDSSTPGLRPAKLYENQLRPS